MSRSMHQYPAHLSKQAKESLAYAQTVVVDRSHENQTTNKDKDKESVRYQFCALTDKGLIREKNEDAVAFDESAGWAALADGMGGYNAGEVASQLAIRYFAKTMRASSVSFLNRYRTMETWKAVMRAAFNQANQAILASAAKHVEHQGMGTTLVTGIFKSDKMLLAHLGDSRCYRLRSGALMQLTHDHSLLQEQLDAGHIQQKDANFSADKHLLTRALGVGISTNLEMNEFAVQAGDLFLFCSDGLTDMLIDSEIEHVLSVGTTLHQKAKYLIQVANLHGGYDNISVLLVKAAHPS